MDPLRGAQLFACCLFGMLLRASGVEILDVRLAIGVVVAGSLPVAWAELAFDRRRTRSRWSRVGTVPLAPVMAGFPRIDLNARFSLATPDCFEATVTAAHCGGKSPHVEFRTRDGETQGSTPVKPETCARTRVAAHVDGERVRGVFEVRISRIVRVGQ